MRFEPISQLDVFPRREDRGSTPNWKPRGCEEAWYDTIVTQDEHCKLRPAVSVFGLKGRRVDLDLVTD